MATTRHAFRIVFGTQQPFFPTNKGDNFTLVPDMIATCDAINTEGIKFFTYLRGNAETMGSIVTVYDNDIGLKLIFQHRQMLYKGIPT